MPTPGEVVLNKDKLLVMSFGIGSSSCRRTRMETWSREADYASESVRRIIYRPANLITYGSLKEELACTCAGRL